MRQKNQKPEDPTAEYPSLILGNWKQIKSIVYYTPTAGGADAAYDATEEDGVIYFKFNTDKTVDVSTTLGGPSDEHYYYSFNGSTLTLTEFDSSEVFLETINVLNSSSMQWQNSNGVASILYDTAGNVLGTAKYVVTDFAKQ